MTRKNKKAPAENAAPLPTKKELKAMKKAEKKEKKAQRKAGKNKVFGSPIRNLIVTALVSALLGVAFILQPTLVFTYCGYALGGIVALVGVAYIIIYFARKPVSGVYHSEFVTGLVALLAGAYVALGGFLTGDGTAGITFNVITKIIGVLVTADGLLKLQYSIDIARMKYPRWWIAFIMAVLGTALGVVVVMGIVYDLGGELGIGANPYYNATQNAFVCGMMALGIAFCLNALLDIIAMIVIAVRNHKANRAEAIDAATAELAAAKREEVEARLPVEEAVVDMSELPVSNPVEPAPVPTPEPVPAAPEPAAPAAAPADAKELLFEPAPAEPAFTPAQQVELDLMSDSGFTMDVKQPPQA